MFGEYSLTPRYKVPRGAATGGFSKGSCSCPASAALSHGRTPTERPVVGLLALALCTSCKHKQELHVDCSPSKIHVI